MQRELSLHILDIAENSLNAGASLITIDVVEDIGADRLTIQIADNGRGMDAQAAARAVDPFYTTRTTRKVGLGLPFLKQAAEMCRGALTVDTAPGRGTTIKATFQRSHIDRMPLGDLAGTILTLIVGNPKVDFVFRHIVEESAGIVRRAAELDTRPIKAELGTVALSEPEVIEYLKNQISDF